MKLTLRFIALVVALLLAVGASAVAGWQALDHLDSALQRVVDQDMDRLLSITHARRVFRSMVVLERDVILARSDEERASLSTKMEALGSELTSHCDHYARSMPHEDAATIVAIRGAQARWLDLHLKVREAVLRGQRDEALAIAKEHAKDPVPWEPALGGLVKLSEKRLTEQVKSAHATYARAKSTLLVVSASAAVLAVGLGTLIFLGIRKTMEEVVDLNANLESLVQQRTKALVERESALRLVLDSTGDALIGVELDGNLNGECSAAAIAWFGEPHEGAPAGAYLFPEDEGLSLSFGLGLEQLVEGFMPWEVAAGQMPQRIAAGENTLELEYKAVLRDDGVMIRFLVIARDVTARERHEASERSAREQHAMITKLLTDKRAFEHYVEDAEGLILRLSTQTDLAVIARDLHTLKGNSAIFGLISLAELCHVVEDRIALTKERPNAGEIANLESLFRTRLQSIETFLTGVGRNTLEVEPQQHQALVTSLLKRRDYDEILRSVELWSWSRTSERLAHLRAQAEYVAKRLGKELTVTIEHNDVRVPPGYLEGVWATLAHAIRNAVDHGIETPEERESLGKPRRGRILMATRETDESLILEIGDDGAGIDWKTLAAAAKERGIEGLSNEELLFVQGLSSRAEVTELSGRGVGMSALQHACQAEGGTIRVSSTPGTGTTFTLTFRRPVVKFGALTAELERRWSLLPPRAGDGGSPRSASANLKAASGV